MSFLNIRRFARQTIALSHKNFLVVVFRNPISFLLWTYGLPLAILAVLANIPSWLSSSNTYGVASPAPINNFTVESGQKLVIVRKPSLGPDVDRVINIFTKGIDATSVHRLDTESDLKTLCLADLRGNSDCHASVTFWDSPETTVTPDLQRNVTDHHTWQYTIRTDPSRQGGDFDATKHNSGEETLLLPLRLAINNAITNMTARPDVFSFTQETEHEQSQQNRVANVATMAQIYPFAMFACYWIIIYRLVSYITTERESGMAQLVDAMGGGTASSARVMSWLLSYNLACLPLFIGFGGLYWRILFRTSSIGSLIGWQILQGLAVNSSTVFAAAFFTKSRVSAVYVIGAFLLVSVGAQVYSFQLVPTLPLSQGVYPLTILFASSNFVYFLQQMSLWEVAGQAAQFSVLPEPADGLNSISYGITQSYMLIFLAINIVVYPILAIVVERLMHGIDFRHRSFRSTKENTTTVAETSDLMKRFTPGFLRKVFCCSRRKSVMAVDGVSLEGHRGQILCLVGPNGSGKTTTLHMMAGFISPTGGSVRLAASPSQIGICPQKNTMWANLTVKEHLNIWSKIKGHERAQDLQELIENCDLTQKTKSLAKTLSGGQMRKLQLACMFVGDPSVCLIDECTSGLDPLSRRVIWDILLQQRSKRSILFTTHFLDEVDVLADHIVILSKGKVRCQGTPAELKMRHGSGYQLSVPRDSPRLDVTYQPVEHQDSLVYSTPDSRSTAKLLSQFTAAGVQDAAVAGPQVEDVFLNVADEPELALDQPFEDSSSKMTPGSIVSFWKQVGILLGKRFTVLKRFWWPYLYVLALPLIITPQFSKLLKDYQQPSCAPLAPDFQPPYPENFYFSSECASHRGFSCATITIGPQPAQKELTKVVDDGFYFVKGVAKNVSQDWEHPVTSKTEFLNYFNDENNRLLTLGGIFQDSDGTQIAYMLDSYRGPTAEQLLSIWSGMNSGVEIISSTGTFAALRKVRFTPS